MDATTTYNDSIQRTFPTKPVNPAACMTTPMNRLPALVVELMTMVQSCLPAEKLLSPRIEYHTCARHACVHASAHA